MSSSFTGGQGSKFESARQAWIDKHATFIDVTLPNGQTLSAPKQLFSSSRTGLIAEADAGRLPPPAKAAEAAAQTPLNSPQQAMVIGEPIPIVFARRRNDVGGVLIFPKATETGFSNTSTQQTARYHCVLSVGDIGQIEVRDFRVGGCRVGTFTQAYNRRAGSWDPGNTATQQTTYQVPSYPTASGGGGAYTGLATLEFTSVTQGGSDDWRLGCNVFVRNGLVIERGRLLDGVAGSSDNFADLLLWALQRSSRVPTAMIDLQSFTDAARFLDTNGLLCNAEFTESGNLSDFMVRTLPYFLLRETRIGGKYGLRPLVPTTANGNIDTSAITTMMVITEAVVLPGSFAQEWSDAGTRLGPRLAMLWRQQDDTSLPIVRTLTVGLERPGPMEQHDLSRFCASEIHAARVGAYLHARRYLSTHTATLTLLPGGQTGQLAQGDVVRVRLPLVTDRESGAEINEFYTIESIAPSADGSEDLTLAHFPVDSQGRSLLALAVAGAIAPGSLLPAPPIDVCDIPGRKTDTSKPASANNPNREPFTQWGSDIVTGGNTTSEGSGNIDPSGGGKGTYDTVIVPDYLPASFNPRSGTSAGDYQPEPGDLPAMLNGPPRGLEPGDNVPIFYVEKLNKALRRAGAGQEIPFSPSSDYGVVWRMTFQVQGGGYRWLGPSIGGEVPGESSVFYLDYSAPWGTGYRIGKGLLGIANVLGALHWVSLYAWISEGGTYRYKDPTRIWARTLYDGHVILDYQPMEITVLNWARIS